ncbi:MAG: VWA domain-containing protein [Alphaproteobacteria bacterium]|nr:VWA domain-containing protein [Alphaproteobacteria bacterium]
MQETLENFLRALRSMEVRVSPAEAIDAHCTVDSVGYGDRTLLKDALCVALAKTEEEVERFDDCFEMFFARDEFRDCDDESSMDEISDADSDLIEEQPLAEMLLGGSETEMAQAMEQAANDAGVANIRFSTQRGLFTRRILDRMGLRDLESLIANLKRAEGSDAAEMAERLEDGRRYLFDEVRQYIDRQFELYARSAGEELRAEFLAKTNLSAIERRDFERMHRMVRRMAKKLATRYNRRRKHTKRGVLDVRRTLRRNMAHDGIPFETLWKQTKIERPRIVVIVDVSQSVAAAARFLLLFLYSLNEVIAKLRSFAFSSHLIEVSDILNTKTVEEAVPEILEKIGFRSTDYGRAFADFEENAMDALDRHTTVIILGDGRSNDTDPRMDLMRQIHDRSKSVIWLNPEPEPFWGTGDSEMHRYRTFCHVAKTCSTIQDLERVIDDVMKSYFRA